MRTVLVAILMIGVFAVHTAQADALLCKHVFIKRNVQTYKATQEDLAELAANYPLMIERIDEFTTSLSEIKFSREKVGSIRELADSQLSGNYTAFRNDPHSLPQDLKRALINVHNDMLDSNKFAQYIKELMLESAVLMMKNRDERVASFDRNLVNVDRKNKVSKEEYLLKGLIDSHSVTKVLVSRVRARGENIAVIPKKNFSGNGTKTQRYEVFFDVPRRGPFFDLAFGKTSSHGQTVHLLQMDYASKTIAEATNNQPRLFWDYATDSRSEHRGSWVWDTMFDGMNSTFMHPEHLKPLLQNHIQLF